MTINLGEEIVAAYLQYIKGCEFIQQSLYTPGVQGEIDVVGIDLETKTVYVCEVAVHLITGLQYVKDSQPNNINKLTEKFSRDIEYTNKYFPNYAKHFMLWSPIVKVSGGKAKFSQMTDIEMIIANIQSKYGVGLECIINRRFADCLAQLREYSNKETKELKSPVLRLMQIEEKLSRHLRRISKTAR
jgi:Holliday junction resolvase-like predicted endonuclease